MPGFEDHLWNDLVRDHGAALPPDGPRPRHRRRGLVRWTGGGTAVAAVCLTIGLLVTSGAAPAAYAVTPHSDGSVTITLRSLNGIQAANKALAALHEQVVLLQGPEACVVTVKAPGLKFPPTLRALSAARAVKLAKLGYLQRGVGTITVKTSALRSHVIALQVAKLAKGRLLLKSYALRSGRPGCVAFAGMPKALRGPAVCQSVKVLRNRALKLKALPAGTVAHNSAKKLAGVWPPACAAAILAKQR